MNLSRFCIGSLKSANSIENINTTESLPNNIKQFANRRKGSPPLRPGSCLDYTFIFKANKKINLYITVLSLLIYQINCIKMY